jgi:hypothetical protein
MSHIHAAAAAAAANPHSLRNPENPSSYGSSIPSSNPLSSLYHPKMSSTLPSTGLDLTIPKSPKDNHEKYSSRDPFAKTGDMEALDFSMKEGQGHHHLSMGSKSPLGSGEFHDQGDAKWIVIRRSLWSHNEMPCGRAAPSRPIGRPGSDCPQGVMGSFSYY